MGGLMCRSHGAVLPAGSYRAHGRQFTVGYSVNVPRDTMAYEDGPV